MEHLKQKDPISLKDTFSFDCGVFCFSLLSTILLMLSTCLYIGVAFFNLSNAQVYSWITFPYAITIAICSAILFCFIYVLVAILYKKINQSVSKASNQAKIIPLKESVKKHFMFLFLIIFICWLPWIIAHYPGSLDQDTVWQTLIWRTQPYWYDHHPWLTTALFGSLMDLGSSLGSQAITLFIFTTLQAIISASFLSLLFCYIKRFNPPKTIWVSFLVLACILPAFPSFASQMAKESLFVVFWIPFILFFVEGIRTKGECFAKPLPIILFVLSIILVILTNKKGIYLTLPCALILILYSKPKLRLVCTSAFIFPLAVSLIWTNILLPSWDVDKGPSKELYSLPLQQTACYAVLYPDDITQTEIDAINHVLPYESLSTIYTLTSTDSVKDTYKDPGTKELLEYLTTWASMGIKHPDSYLVATMGTNYRIFTPVVPFQLKEDLDQSWVDEQVSFFSQFLSEGIDSNDAQLRDSKTTEGLAEPESLEPIRNVVYTYEKILNYTPIRFLNSPAFFVFYVPLFILCFALSKYAKNNRSKMLLALIPSFLVIASIIAGPLVLDRYCLPGLFIVALVISLPWILISKESTVAHSET